MNAALQLQLSQKKSSVARISHTCTGVYVTLAILLDYPCLLPKLNTFHMPDDPIIQIGTCKGRLQQESYNQHSTKL